MGDDYKRMDCCQQECRGKNASRTVTVMIMTTEAA